MHSLLATYPRLTLLRTANCGLERLGVVARSSGSGQTDANGPYRHALVGATSSPFRLAG